MARVKHSQRLDFNRLAEVLAERGLVDVEPIRELLQASNDGGQPFPEALVAAGLLTDWDLGRVVCEVFHLPFLPADLVKPNPELVELFEPGFLVEHGLVPMARFGNLLTLALPGLVQAETLAFLAAETDLVLLPVVSTVQANRRWLAEHVKLAPGAALGDDWGSLFDQGDAAVQQAISSVDEVECTEDLGAFEAALEGAQAEVEEDEVGASRSEFDLDSLPSLAETGETSDDEAEIEQSAKLDLPPMPEFGG